MTEQHIKVIIYNALCAANYIHSGTVVHRDLKPSNLLMSNTCNIKLCDFGLARTIEPKLSDASAPTK